MIDKRKTVIKNRIKKALIPAAIREKKAAQRLLTSVKAQIADTGVLDRETLFVDCADTDREIQALEQQYQELMKGKDGIQVHFLFNLALGAFVQTFLIAKHNKADCDNKLHIMVPAKINPETGDVKLPNPEVPKFFDFLFVPDKSNIRLYLYILNYHFDEIDLTTWSSFAPGSLEADGSKDAYADYRGFKAIEYSEEEKRHGDEYLKKIGVTGRYVSFRNRVAKGGSLGGVRNGDTSTYYKAVDYLQNNGIQCVYVGLNENADELGNGIIDASKQYDAMMDLYIHSKADFFMGDHSGIISFAQLFDRPMILLNLPYFTMSGDAYGPTFVERDLLLPEKIFDTKNKKYLTIRQMLEYEMTYPEYKDLVEYYVNNGFVFEKNTEDEILSVVKEMLARIEGTFAYSAEERKLMDRYFGIMQNNADRYEAKWCRASIGIEFLKNNQWLLD